jgi:hypothetical protein
MSVPTGTARMGRHVALTLHTTRRDIMKKLLTGALALALAAALAGCNKTTPSASPSSTSTGASSSSASSSTSSTTGTTSSAGATATAVDQSTPEAAMTSWLNAMVAGNGKTVCALMAAEGKAIEKIPTAAEQCGKTITPMLEQLKELGGAFAGLSITGATVKGTTATFEAVTTKPALAAEVVSSFKAVKIGTKWYVTQ